MKWDENLEGPARRIAAADHSPLRVLAGPGTGKTFAMMRRVARLLEEGAEPQRMFFCTFTRTAAIDLQKSLRALGEKGMDEVRAGTLHSFCFELLNASPVMKLTGRVARPILGFEQEFLIQDLCGGDLGGVRECKKRVKAFDAGWARLQTEAPGWCEDPVDREFESRLMSWLRFHRAMLIGEVVPEALKYLRSNPAAEERSRYRHVLVDEYQDLNRAEQVILDLISEAGTLTVVGDEDQSIYSFKHAHPEGISAFEATHPGTHDENLVECRRCPTLVVELANRLIGNNRARASRRLQPGEGKPPGEVIVVQWRTMEDEAAGIAKMLRSRIGSGEIAPGQVLVLATRRRFGYAIRDALKAADTPAHSFFNEEALDGNSRKPGECLAAEALTLLTLLADPEDRVALRCWCGFGSESLRSGAWGRLRTHCEGNGISPREALLAVGSGSLKVPNTKDLVVRFKELEERLAHLGGLTGPSLIDSLFPKGEPWSEPVRALAGTIDADRCEPKDLLDHLRTSISQPELPTDVDYVRVMSLHKSKGLTAEMVVVVGCVEGAIPRIEHDLGIEEQQAMHEEQRRLFYVALTRPTKSLVISNFTQLPREFAHKMRIPLISEKSPVGGTIASTFINELGPSCPQSISGFMFLQNFPEC